MIEQKPAAMRESRDIEWLVNWALEKQRVLSTGSGSVMPAGLRSQLGSLGMKVDGGKSGAADTRWAHADAQVIGDALIAMPSRIDESISLVIYHGNNGTQPEWGAEGCGRYELVRRQRRGRYGAVKRYSDQRNARGLLGFSWEWVGHTVESLDRMMLSYLAWHTALGELREIVNPKLRTYVATGPRASAAPWDDPVLKPSSAHGVQRALARAEEI